MAADTRDNVVDLDGFDWYDYHSTVSRLEAWRRDHGVPGSRAPEEVARLELGGRTYAAVTNGRAVVAIEVASSCAAALPDAHQRVAAALTRPVGPGIDTDFDQLATWAEERRFGLVHGRLFDLVLLSSVMDAVEHINGFGVVSWLDSADDESPAFSRIEPDGREWLIAILPRVAVACGHHVSDFTPVWPRDLEHPRAMVERVYLEGVRAGIKAAAGLGSAGREELLSEVLVDSAAWLADEGGLDALLAPPCASTPSGTAAAAAVGSEIIQ